MEKIFFIAIDLIEIIAYIVFFLLFFPRDYRFSPFATYCLAGFLFTCFVSLAILLEISSEELPFNHFILSITAILGFLIFLTVIVKCPLHFKLFLIFSYKIFFDMVSLLTKEGLLHQTVILQTTFAISVTKYLLLMPVAVAILFFITKKLIPIFRETGDMHFWRYLWLLPLTFYLLYRFSVVPGYVYESCPTNAAYFIRSYIWAIGTCFIYYSIVQTLLKIQENRQLEAQLYRVELQTALHKQHYQSLLKRLNLSRAARHDFRHHVRAFQGYVTQNDLDGLNDYLTDYMENVLPETMPICENSIVSTVIDYYKAFACELDIRFSTAVKLPPDLPIPDTELAIVFSELLNNGLQACLPQGSASVERQLLRRNCSISIHGTFLGQTLSIITETRPYHKPQESESLLNSRYAPLLHIAKKHEGKVTFSYKFDVDSSLCLGADFQSPSEIFQVSVLLNMSDERKVSLS